MTSSVNGGAGDDDDADGRRGPGRDASGGPNGGDGGSPEDGGRSSAAGDSGGPGGEGLTGASTTRVSTDTALEADHSLGHLFDGCLEGTPECTTGSNQSEQMVVELDFRARHELEALYLFGDTEGSWQSRTMDVESKPSAGESYRMLAQGIDVFASGWTEHPLDRTARMLRITVHGMSGSGKVQARELEVTGQLADGETLPEDTIGPADAPAPPFTGVPGSGRELRVACDGSGDFGSVSGVNGADLQRGDRVLFERGCTFEGSTLQAQAGVTYADYGSGQKPTIANVNEGIVPANETVFRNLRLVDVDSAAILIYDKEDVLFDGLELERVVMNDANERAVPIYNSSRIAFVDSSFGDMGSDADDFIYSWLSENLHFAGNHMVRNEPSSGDCIQLTGADGYYIGYNVFRHPQGGKGVLVASTWEENGSDGLVEHNDVSSNSFGLSVRTRNSEVRYNYLHDVALEPDSPDWAGALWMAAGYAEQNWQPVTGIEIHNNVVENVHRGFAGGDS
jgi:hypothetical protein